MPLLFRKSAAPSFRSNGVSESMADLHPCSRRNAAMRGSSSSTPTLSTSIFMSRARVWNKLGQADLAVDQPGNVLIDWRGNGSRAQRRGAAKGGADFCYDTCEGHLRFAKEAAV